MGATRKLIYMFVFCVILWFIQGCQNEKDEPFSVSYEKVIEIYKFPTEYNLKGRNVGPEFFFSNPTDIMFDEDCYLVLDSKKEKIFNIINDEYKVISSFGSIGDGPNSFSSNPQVIKNEFIKNKEILAYQFSSDNIIKIKIDKILNNFKSSDNLKIHIPTALYNVQYISSIDTSRYVGLGG